MSIRDKRLKIEIDNVIKQNLSRGYIPTANEVVSELSRYLMDNNLSVPTYKFTSKDNKFTARDMDSAKQLTLQDLNILYQSLVDLYQLSEEQIEKFATEKKKYDYRLASLESQLTSLVNKYSTSGYTVGYRNSFSDMESIDPASTTADVDIINNEATLKRLQDIPYTDFTISLSSTQYVEQSGDIKTYMNTTGAAWQGIVEKTKQEETTLSIDIDTKHVNDINKLEIDAPMLKKCMVTIYTSLDGDKWTQEYEGAVTNRCATNFSTKLRYVRVIFKKAEADKFVLGKYVYYFIIDSIKLDAVNYSLESDIVSRPINAGTNINKVSIVSDASMPPATSIQYYVAMNSDSPNWIPISPLNGRNNQYPTVVAFNTVETDQRLSITIPEGVSNDAYELRNLSVNGQRMFAIAEINGVDITDYRLYKGINAWKVESLGIGASGPQTQSLFINNAQSIGISYQPIIIDKPGLLMNAVSIGANTVKRFSTTINREAGDTVVKEMIASSHPVSVFLNGNILYKGTPSNGAVITYPFKKGSNLLEVIVNIQSAPAVASLDLNLSMFSIGSMICANRNPMEPVSLFNLRYNTNNQYDVYALYDTGDKYMIIVKDPDLAIRYDFVYDYVTTPASEILVKATLKREHASINITPRLMAYEIRFI